MFKKLVSLTCVFALAFSSLMVSANAASPKAASLNSNDVLSANDFGLKLYNSLYDNNNNVFMSPVSVYLALSMVTNGAAGNTQKQLLSSLKNNSIASLNNFNKSMQSYIVNNRPNTQISIANSIWIRDNFYNSVNNKFLNTNKNYYNSKIAALNFSNKSAVDTINKWVSDNTKGLIPKAIDKQIAQDVMMYLVNTVYFKADWQLQFNKGNTIKSDFTTPKGTVKVDMMNNKKSFNYLENNQLQMISLPYKDGKTSMLVILPKGNLNSIKNSLTAKNINSWIKSMQYEQVQLSLPKVNAQYKTGLKPALESLGIKDMFSLTAANFSNMASKKLYASDAQHSTVLKIDELGTEAAAVTSVEMSLTSMPLNPPKVMNVNKPFFTAIYDNTTGLILFAGSITNPQ